MPDVNSIRNVFPKDNAEWLNWILQNKALYLDKEKIQALIDQQRTNLADVEYLDLDSIAKIVENFENPSTDEGTLFRTGEPITYNNFYKETAGVWEIINPSEVPSREADYTSTRFMRPDLVSSKYWYGSDERGDYVIRESDHWSATFYGENSINDFMANPSSRRYVPISSVRWAIGS